MSAFYPNEALKDGDTFMDFSSRRNDEFTLVSIVDVHPILRHVDLVAIADSISESMITGNRIRLTFSEVNKLSLEYVGNVLQNPQTPAGCSCEIFELMNRGCKCGGV